MTREETDYRFEIIVYMHRKFQMFEFPPFMDVNKREKSVPSFFKLKLFIKFGFFPKLFTGFFGLATLSPL